LRLKWFRRRNNGFAFNIDNFLSITQWVLCTIFAPLAPIASSAQRLFPTLSLEAVLAHLLLEHAQKNLIRYQSMIHQFEMKYGQQFEHFRQQILTTNPDFETEQDYFDWELNRPRSCACFAQSGSIRHNPIP